MKEIQEKREANIVKIAFGLLVALRLPGISGTKYDEISSFSQGFQEPSCSAKPSWSFSACVGHVRPLSSTGAKRRGGSESQAWGNAQRVRSRPAGGRSLEKPLRKCINESIE